MPQEHTPKKKNFALSPPLAALLLAVVLIGMIAMFALGLYAGRRDGPLLYDYADMRAELANVKAALVSGEIAAGKKREKPVDIQEEAKSEAGETAFNPSFVTPVEKAPRTVSPEVQPAVRAAAAAVTPATRDAAGAAKDGKKPAEASGSRATAEAQAVSPAAKPSPWTIQVAAVNRLSEAVQLVGKLRKKGFPAWTVAVHRQGGGDFYRVRVGRFDTRAQAEMVRASLAESAPESFVTKD